MNAYIDHSLQYPLHKSEYNLMNKVWEFISIMTEPIRDFSSYRKDIIKTIKNKYSIDEFYRLEKITEKILWNIRHRSSYFFNEQHNIIDGTYTKIFNEYKKDNSYRSFINKLILFDANDGCHYKKMEGSSNIFDHNEFNVKTFMAIFNRNIYESCMNDPNNVKKNEIPGFYYEMDYPFPNLNYYRPFIQDKNDRINRIQKMYYDIDSEKNWYKIIKPIKKLKQ